MEKTDRKAGQPKFLRGNIIVYIRPSVVLFFILNIISCYQEPLVPEEVLIPPSGSSSSSSSGGGSITYAERMSIFDSYTVKGVGGDQFMAEAAAIGANTFRTWAIGSGFDTANKLNEAVSHGAKIILGHWMPEHQNTSDWRDYVNGTATKDNIDTISSHLNVYGNHPGILAWGLGNEVALSAPYLQCVNILSIMIHDHNPSNITCIVTVNAPQSTIDLIKLYAPDVDMIGANSYGNVSVNNSKNNLETYWGKKYFISEYNCRGTWVTPVTTWGAYNDDPPAVKLNDLDLSIAAIETGPNCVGSVVFLWSPWTKVNYIWFSTLLPVDPQKNYESGYMNAPIGEDGMVPLYTPYSDRLMNYFTGSYPVNRAPLISAMSINGTSTGSINVTAGVNFSAVLTATDPETDVLTYKWWVYNYTNNIRGNLMASPIDTGVTNSAIITAPSAGTYMLLGYALDQINNNASAYTLNFRSQ